MRSPEERLVTEARLPILAKELKIGGSNEIVVTTATYRVTVPGDFLADVATTLTLPDASTVTLMAGEAAAIRHFAGGWQVFTGSAGGSTPAVPDTTAPTAGSLAVSMSTTSAALTVSGALDDVTLHAAPYRFSKDGGATFVAWQASPSYTFTPLTPDTEFTFVHETRDAAGNVKRGGAQVKRTLVQPTWSTVAADDFTAADGTALAGRATPTGGLVWTATEGTPTITGNAFSMLASNTPAGAKIAEASATSKGIRATADYTLTTVGGLQGSLWVQLSLVGAFWIAVKLMRQADGTIKMDFQDYGAGGWTADLSAASGVPASGVISVEVSPTGGSGVVLVNGAKLATVAGPTTKTFSGVIFRGVNGCIVDNVKYERSNV